MTRGLFRWGRQQQGPPTSPTASITTAAVVGNPCPDATADPVAPAAAGGRVRGGSWADSLEAELANPTACFAAMQAGIACLQDIPEQTYIDSARFADGTLTGLWDSTGGALVEMASHPGETALGLLSLAVGGYTGGLIGTDPRAGGQAMAEDLIAKASSADPRDHGLLFGEVLGTLATIAVGGELSSISKATEPVAWASRAGEASEVPAAVFSRSRAPGLAENFDSAVSNGSPTRLTRVDAAARDANRRAALRGQAPAPGGQSLDEYPFACSAQGGCGSSVRAVPVGEQSYQGGVLSSFFQRFGIKPGDLFDVIFEP